MLFVGGYPQTVFGPLIATLLLALVASYFISITAVPLLSLYFLSIKNPLLLKVEEGFNYVISRVNDAIQAFFASIVRGATAFKSVAFALVVALIILFVISVKLVMPTVGQEAHTPNGHRSNRHQNNHRCQPSNRKDPRGYGENQ